MSRRDPDTGLTDEELVSLAEEAYERRDDDDAWEDEEPPEISPNIRSVVSVRFNPGELGLVEQAAAAAGVPLSTYIRNAAMSAVSAIDMDQARRGIHALRRQVEDLGHVLGVAPQPNPGGKGRTSRRGRAA